MHAPMLGPLMCMQRKPNSTTWENTRVHARVYHRSMYNRSFGLVSALRLASLECERNKEHGQSYELQEALSRLQILDAFLGLWHRLGLVSARLQRSAHETDARCAVLCAADLRLARRALRCL